MTTNASQLLQLAHIYARQGNFAECRELVQDVAEATKELDPSTWLESVRLHFQCSQELDHADGSRAYIEEVILLTQSSEDFSILARAFTLLGSWALAQNEADECRHYLQNAINKATEIQDLATLARALFISAVLQTLDPSTLASALVTLDKVDILLSEAHHPETLVSSKIFRGFIYIQKSEYDLALATLWLAYEQSQKFSLHTHCMSALTQIARVHMELKQHEQHELLYNLLSKGLDKVKTPRLYRGASQVFLTSSGTATFVADFRINQANKSFFVKNKGAIDFKNQHILFELALLFLEAPGTRFSKEALVEKIWGQIYDPKTHDNLIYVSIKRLRTLIEPDPESPHYLLRDRKGYYLNPQSSIQLIKSEDAAL